MPAIWLGRIALLGAMTAFGWKAGDEVGDDLGDAVKLAALAGAGYLIWKAVK